MLCEVLFIFCVFFSPQETVPILTKVSLILPLLLPSASMATSITSEFLDGQSVPPLSFSSSQLSE